MSETKDIVERAKVLSGMLVTSEKIPFGSDAELITELALEVTDLRQRNEHAASMLTACGIEQSRLRSLLQEAVEALDRIKNFSEGSDWTVPPTSLEWDAAIATARAVLAKARGTE